MFAEVRAALAAPPLPPEDPFSADEARLRGAWVATEARLRKLYSKPLPPGLNHKAKRLHPRSLKLRAARASRQNIGYELLAIPERRRRSEMIFAPQADRICLAAFLAEASERDPRPATALQLLSAGGRPLRWGTRPVWAGGTVLTPAAMTLGQLARTYRSARLTHVAVAARSSQSASAYSDGTRTQVFRLYVALGDDGEVALTA